MKVPKKPDLPIISGCLRGLNGYLAGFPQTDEDGKPF